MIEELDKEPPSRKVPVDLARSLGAALGQFTTKDWRSRTCFARVKKSQTIVVMIPADFLCPGSPPMFDLIYGSASSPSDGPTVGAEDLESIDEWDSQSWWYASDHDGKPIPPEADLKMDDLLGLVTEQDPIE